jgi:hypothetical protein
VRHTHYKAGEDIGEICMLLGKSGHHPHSAFVLCLFLLAFCTGAVATIRLPEQSPDFVRWAATDVAQALESAGVAPSQAKIVVFIDSQPSPDDQSFELARRVDRIEIRGGGPLGAMYGLLEAGEQIRNAGKTRAWSELATRMAPAKQRPFAEIRADNPFVHVPPLLTNDVPMWKAYIDMLARNRFNMLDLHGAYDLHQTNFPNLYPMLIHVPEYPEVGNEQEQNRNLANFKEIVRYAKSRGIRVAFMNYAANDGLRNRRDQPTVTGVPPEKLADYTAKAVARLIKQVPDLYMLGFRVGESGQDAGFYKNAYLKGVQESGGKDLRLYTRSWQTTKEQLMPIAQAAPGNFDIEIKFNGEHLGLPYHSLQGSFGSYSYESYLDLPPDYGIIWQVRANGTHRFWSWENTEFVRRTVRTFSLGNARGFSIEPHIAYFSTYPNDHYRSAADRGVYQYTWQKHWMWYYAWGRLSYNPDLSENTIIKEFERHFGPSGKSIYEAMQQSGKIVPLVYAFRFQGPDHRDFSPETETGISDTKKKRARQDMLQFAENHPEDERSFAGIDDFVLNRMANKSDGRVSPIAVAGIMARAAEQTRKLTSRVETLTGPAAGEWRLLKADLLSSAALGEYYAARINGMLHLDYALKTGSEVDYAKARQYLDASRPAWKTLADTADAVYGPLTNPLRRQDEYQWSSQLSLLEKADSTVEAFWNNRTTRGPAKALEFTAADRGEDMPLIVRDVKHEVSGDRAVIVCTATAKSGVANVILWYKQLPSSMKWQSVAMESSDQVHFKVVVPMTEHGVMYHLEVQDSTGQARNFPEVLKETPYWIIPPYPATGAHAAARGGE